MHSVSGFVGQRLGRKIGIKTVSCRNCIYNRAERHGVVRGGNGIRIPEIYFVLTRSLFMVRTLGSDAHLLQRETYFAPHVFALIVGCYVHISCGVVRGFGGLPVFVAVKKIKFHFRAEGKSYTFFFCVLRGAS